MRRAMLIGCGLLLAAAAADAQRPDEKQKRETVKWLRELQWTDSGFGLFHPGSSKEKEERRPSLRGTSSGVRALKYWGGQPESEKGVAKFLTACRDADTGGYKTWALGDVEIESTALGVLAAAELKLPADEFIEPAMAYLAEKAQGFEEVRLAAAAVEAAGKRPAAADNWLKELQAQSNPDGTFGQGDGAARDTASAVVTILRLGGKAEKPEAVLKLLKAGQRKDGGFGKADAPKSDLETSYRVMRAYHMLKAKPDADALRRFVASCRNKDAGYGMAAGQDSNASATYFAGVILVWLDEK
jgi:prenyltransferase beta subunit